MFVSRSTSCLPDISIASTLNTAKEEMILETESKSSEGHGDEGTNN